MSAALIVAGIVLVALVLYVLLAGADFGGGILDVFARGPRQQQQRDTIEHAIGPVWETNHVWLILVIVLLFTCFPPVFAAISVSLFVPLVGLLFCIVFRGAAFVFRAYDTPLGSPRRRWGYVFSLSSAVAPIMLGSMLGATMSGRLCFDRGVFAGDFFSSWLAFYPLTVGLLTLGVFAYIAAVYLTVESQGDVALDFRRQALVALVAVLVLAAFTAVLARTHAPLIWTGLTSKPWSPALLVGASVCSAVAFHALWQRRYRLARVAAVAQITLFILGWGLSQLPYLIVPSFTVTSASAPPRTLALVLAALAVGSVLLFPSLFVLFRVFKSGRDVTTPTPPR